MPVDAGVTPNANYVTLATNSAMKKYPGLNLAVIGGSFKVNVAIPAKTVITIATCGMLISRPLFQHEVSCSNDHFIPAICWMEISGELKFYAQSEIPVTTYIHFSDCYVYNTYTT